MVLYGFQEGRKKKDVSNVHKYKNINKHSKVKGRV